MSDFDLNNFFTHAASGSLDLYRVRQAIAESQFTMDSVDTEGNWLLDIATAAGNWNLIDSLIDSGLINAYSLPQDHFVAFALKHAEETFSPRLLSLTPPSWWTDSKNVEIRECLQGEWVLDAIAYGYWPMLDITLELFGEYTETDLVMLAVTRILGETDYDGSALVSLKNLFSPEAKCFERLTLDSDHQSLKHWGSITGPEMEAYAPVNGLDINELNSQEWSLLNCEYGIYLHPEILEGGGFYSSIDGNLHSALMLLHRNASSDMPDDWF